MHAGGHLLSSFYYQFFFLVTLKLKSKVALVNTTVEFSCAGYGSEDNTCAEAQVELNDNIEKLTNKLQVNISQYAAEITKTQNDTTNFVTFTIKILAKLANNNTKIVCDFCPDYNFKTEARLYIASGNFHDTLLIK